MAYPAFRTISGLTWTNTFGANVLTTTVPADAVAGDLCVVIASVPQTGMSAGQTMTISGGGWSTPINKNQGTGRGFLISSKIVTTDMIGSTLTVTLNDNYIIEWGLYNIVFSNACQPDPSSGAYAISSNTYTYYGITTSVNETLVLRLHASSPGGGTMTAPTMPATSRLSATGPASGTSTYSVQIGISTENGPATAGAVGSVNPGGIMGWTTMTMAIEPPQPPLAPTLVTPLSNAYKALYTGDATFTWQHNPQPGGTAQASFCFRRKLGAGSYEYYTVATHSWGGSEVWNTSSLSTLTFPTSEWATGENTYVWSIATKDANGMVSPYAADRTIYTRNAPTVTITFPTGGNYPRYALPVTWTATCGGSATQIACRLKVFNEAQFNAAGFDPQTSKAVWDSGIVNQSATSYTIPAEDHTLEPPSILDNFTLYRVYVWIQQTGGQWQTVNTYAAWTNSTPAPFVPNLTATLVSSPAPGIKLTITDGGNLLSPVDADLETTSGSTWTALDSNTTVVAGEITSQAASGLACGSLKRASTTGTASAFTNLNYWTIPSGTFYVKAKFRAAQAQGRSCRVGIDWIDSNGSTVVRTDWAGNVTDNNTGWVESSATIVAPSNGWYMRIRLEVASTLSTETHYFDSVCVQTLAGSWSAGCYGQMIYRVQYQDGDSGVWANLPGFTILYNNGMFFRIREVVDYLAPRGVQRQYRVMSWPYAEEPWSAMRPGSAWSSTASATLTDTGSWLVDAQYPSSAYPVSIGTDAPRAIPRGQGVFSASGSGEKNVVDDVVRLQEGTTTFVCKTAEETDSIVGILISGHTLCMRWAAEDGVLPADTYFRVVGDIITRRIADDELYAWREIVFDWVEQDPPDSLVVESV